MSSILAPWVLMGISAVSAAAPCTKQQEREALDHAAGLRSWSAVHGSFLKYRHCDDGAIAEGYSESVTLLLADQWQLLPQLARLTEKDEGFRRFVLRHVDETAPRARLDRIAVNARQRCPQGLSPLCEQLAASAKP